MNAIPIDVLRRIFDFLDDPSHFAAAATCRTWRQARARFLNTL